MILSETPFAIAREGIHVATITEVRDKGLTETKLYTKDQLEVVFRTGQKDAEGNFMEVWVPFTKSLSKMSHFRKFLDTLQIPVNGEFDTDTLIGLTLTIVVQHRELPNGKKYANVVSFIRRPKRPTPVPVTPDNEEINA